MMKESAVTTFREDAVCPACPDPETAFRIEDVGTTVAWEPDPHAGVVRATVTRPAWEAAMMGHLRSRSDAEHLRLYDLCVTDLMAAGVTAKDLARYSAQAAAGLVRESLGKQAAR